MEVVVGTRGDSCTSVCSSIGKDCADPLINVGMQKINGCHIFVMKSYTFGYKSEEGAILHTKKEREYVLV